MCAGGGGGGGGKGGGGVLFKEASTDFNHSVLPEGVCTSSNQCFNLGSATATAVIINRCVPSWIPLTAIVALQVKSAF